MLMADSWRRAHRAGREIHARRISLALPVPDRVLMDTMVAGAGADEDTGAEIFKGSMRFPQRRCICRRSFSDIRHVSPPRHSGNRAVFLAPRPRLSHCD